MIRPSIRMSVLSYSQICTRVFCDAEVGTGQHEWGLAAAGSKALQRLQLRQAQAAHVLQKPEDQVLRKRRKGGRRGSAVWSVRW